MDDKQAIKSLKEYAADLTGEDRPCVNEVIGLLRQEDYKGARKAMKACDTYVREGFPDAVSSHVAIQAAGGVRKILAAVVIKGSKRVYKKGWRPGVVAMSSVEFPKDARDRDIALSLVHYEEQLLKQTIGVEFKEVEEDDDAESGS